MFAQGPRRLILGKLWEGPSWLALSDWDNAKTRYGTF